MAAYLAGVRHKLHSSAYVLYRSLLLVAQSTPSELQRLVFANLVSGAGPAMLLYLGKIVIDQTVILASGAPLVDPLSAILARPALLLSIIGVVVVNALLDPIDTIRIFVSTALRDRLQGIVKGRIYRKIAEFEDIALFENPKLLDTLQLAQQSLSRFSQFASAISEIMVGIFVVVPVLSLSFSIAWWVPLLIFLSAIPSIWVQMHYGAQSWNVEKAQATVVRQINIHEHILTGPEYAKELRQFWLQSFILERWSKLFWSAFEEMRRLRNQGARAVLAWSVLSGRAGLCSLMSRQQP